MKQANRIRDRVYATTPFALTRNALLDEAGTSYYLLGRTAITRLLRRSRGGLWCGGVAWRLFREYESRGFPCAVIDLGWPVFSHVVTVVGVATPSGNRMVVQDATFNHTYVDSYGSPAAVGGIVQAARAGTTSGSLRLSSGPSTTRPVIARQGGSPWSFLPLGKLHLLSMPRADMRAASLYGMPFEESLPHLREHFDALRADGLPVQLESVYAYPRAVATRATQTMVDDPAESPELSAILRGRDLLLRNGGGPDLPRFLAASVATGS